MRRIAAITAEYVHRQLHGRTKGHRVVRVRPAVVRAADDGGDDGVVTAGDVAGQTQNADDAMAAQKEGAGEENVPEGESTSHLTSGLAAPSSAAAANLRHDDADAAPANRASAATTDAANANAGETTTSSGGDTGGDTHVVSFEGSRDRIIVVAKKMSMQRWLAGSDEVDVFVKHVFKTFMLTPIIMMYLWCYQIFNKS